MDKDTIISCENLSKKFCRDLKKSLLYGVQDVSRDLFPFLPRKRDTGPSTLRNGEFWALKDVSIELKKGESLGLIGRNGAGKTTMLKLLSGLIKPDEGSVGMRGRVGALIALGAGFNPILTGLENIRINAGILGFTRGEIDAKMDEIIDFAGLPDEALYAPVRTYSSGMQARLGFSVAANLDPDILLVDEVLAVGDMAFRRKCDGLMHRFRKNGGTLILVTHNAYHVSSICAKGLWLKDGEVAAVGGAPEVTKAYLEESLEGQEASDDQSDELGRPLPIIFKSVRAYTVGEEKAFVNSDVCIELSYFANEDFDDVKISSGFYTTSGDLRIGSVLPDENPPEKLNIRKGPGRMSYVVKNCSLAPGNYQIRGGVFGREDSCSIATFGWETAPFSFRIHPNGLASAFAAERGDIVLLESGLFSVDPEGA